jgi:cyclopropane-fatty-acyl-phospholipid synthase
VRAALRRSGAGLAAGGAPAAAAAAADAAATIFTLPVGAYMAAQCGGYTGAPPPLHAPALAPTAPLLSSLLSGASAALRYAAMSPVLTYLRASIVVGCIVVRLPDGSEQVYGDRAAPLHLRARLAVYAWGFFTRVARESDLGLARSFIDGEWGADDLTALFNVFIANRDASALSTYGMWTAWVGLTLNFARFALAMDNSVANSRSNIHAHYDLSNDLFTSFLDPATMMYSCGFFDTRRRRLVVTDLTAPAVAPAGAPAPAPPPARLSFEETELAVLNSVPAAGGSGERVEVLYGGTLEEAQLRKLDHLIARACVSKGDKVLDLGFGWGGLSIRLAETIGCRVVGITLSQEQHDLAVERVRARGLSHLITFEIVDYRVFAEAHKGEFDRILSIEMIEAVGHNYFPSFMASLDKLLAPGGVIALQAITMPEARYAEYLTTTDFINTVIFPGGCCPSLAALTDAMMRNSSLMLNSVDQFALHYGETLRRWRANFNAALDTVVRPLGFDDVFIRTWNYYLCYCGAWLCVCGGGSARASSTPSFRFLTAHAHSP